MKGLGVLCAVTVAVGASGCSRVARWLCPREDEGAALVKAAGRFAEFQVTQADRVADASEKVARLRAFMQRNRYDAAVVGTRPDFSWITGGGSHGLVDAGRSPGVLLVVTPTAKHVVASNAEAQRILDEEVAGQGYEARTFLWYDGQARQLEPLLKGKRVVTDVPLACCPEAQRVGCYAPLYAPLTALEVRRYRWLGRKTSEALERVAAAVRPGMTERDANYLLHKELCYWGIAATASAAAADQRVAKYPRPSVAGATLRRYLSLSVRARRWGLVVAATRCVYFGSSPRLARAFERAAVVGAKLCAATRAGRTLGDVFAAAQEAYAEADAPGAWRLADVGGPVAYDGPTALARPRHAGEIRKGMAFAWRPSLAGAKMENTYLLTEQGLEPLTPCLTWPAIEVKLGGRVYRMPGLRFR